MRNLSFIASLRFASVALLAAVIFGATFEADAQRRKKPVVRRKTVVRKPVAVRKVTPVLYTVASGEKIRVRLEDELNSKTAKVGDTFTTKTTEPVYATSGETVIPVGSTIMGRVDAVSPAKKGGKAGSIDASFYEVRLPNGTRRAINGTLTSLNSDDAKSNNEGTASGDDRKNDKLIFIGGGAGGGAILGAAVGGGKGALIGGIIGGIAGAITENQTRGEEAKVEAGTAFGVQLNQAISMQKYNDN